MMTAMRTNATGAIGVDAIDLGRATGGGERTTTDIRLPSGVEGNGAPTHVDTEATASGQLGRTESRGGPRVGIPIQMRN
jgi:hypothetical protein